MTEFDALRDQLTKMSGNLEALTTVLTQIAPRMEKVEAQMSEVQAERSQNQQAIAAAQSAEVQQKASEVLVTAILAGLGDQIKTEVSASIGKAINPSGQPRQKTMVSPISASQMAEEVISASAAQIELIRAEAQLELLRGRDSDPIDRSRLNEKIRALRYQIQES